MAFTKKKVKARVAKPYSTHRPIVASAQRINLSNRVEADRTRARATTSWAWQSEAWTYYDEIGEIKFAYGLVASVISRLRLFPGIILDPNAPPVSCDDPVLLQEPEPEVAEGEEGEEPDALADTGLANDAAEAVRRREIDPKLIKAASEAFDKQFALSSISGILRQASLNINIAGECLLVLHKNVWTARSTAEVKVTAGTDGFQLKRSRSEGEGMQTIPADQATVGRVWRQHPQFSLDPDSAMISIRTDCEELLLLSRMVRSITRSKLNAGILYIPDEISATARTQPDDGSKESELEADPLEAELLYTMVEPINQETSAAGVVPMLLRGPAEFADSVKYITMDRKSDEFLVSRAERVLERILQGLDVPKDIVTGLANVKYSNAIKIDESMYQAHVEPLALMICDALTEIVLRPHLQAAGFTPEEAAQVAIWYDPSEVVTRPNRSQDANDGFDRFALSASAWRDAHGFGDTDAPDEDELALRIAVKATPPPEILTALMNKLLPGIMGEAQEANTQGAQAFPDDLSELLDGGTPAVTPEVAESSVP